MKMTLHLTEKCNMACNYCYYPKRGNRSTDFETMKAAIDLSIKNDSSTGISFFGGEPLLERELLEEILGYTTEVNKKTGHPFYYKITTNGTLIDESFLQLANQHCILIAVSHDGLMQQSGRIYSNSCNLTEEKLKLLLQYQPFAVVFSIATPQSVIKLAESVQWLFEIGFRYLFPSPAYGSHIGWNDESMRILEQQYHKLSELYIKWTKAGNKFYLGLFESKIDSHLRGEAYCEERCHLGRDQFSIAVDGKIYPCTQFVGDNRYLMGTVWAGIDMQQQKHFSSRRIIPETCEGCSIKNRCNHTCGCINKLDTGDLEQVSPMQCAHERILLPIVDKMAEKLYKNRNQRFIKKHYDPNYPLISFLEERLVPMK